MINRLFKLPGAVLQAVNETATIAWNGSGDLYDWIVNINRLRIETFAKRRFRSAYDQLDGGDLRIMTAFLEPEWVSNTASLLMGRRGSRSDDEFDVTPTQALAWLVDAYGAQATHDNSFVSAQDGAYDGAERWFFINGIATSRDLTSLSAKALQSAFNRSFITVHNPTQGVVHDLVEATLQKFTNINTEPVARAFLDIADALLSEQVEKVVVIAHSQGSIVMGDVLDLLYCAVDATFLDRTNMNDDDLQAFMSVSHGTVPAYELMRRFDALQGHTEQVAKKLELYMFANAASRMCYLDTKRYLPHIESFVNERDIVTRLGALAPDAFHREDLIRIDGPVFSSRRYGHLFNTHYLPQFEQGDYRPLAPSEDRCIGGSVHDDVRGNPCDKNLRRTPGPTMSKLRSYLAQSPLARGGMMRGTKSVGRPN